MKLLVTGATGFVGANLVRALLDVGGSEIFISARKSSNFWRLDNIKEKLKIVYVDLADRDAVFEMINQIKPVIVYHVATYGGFPGQVDKEQIIRSNLMATINLLDASIEHSVIQFINTGSSSEYGIKNEPMHEDDVCEPINFYGVTKLAATNYCTMIGKTLNYRVCTLRLFSPYGQFEDKARLYPSIISTLKRGEKPKLSKSDSVRDFIPIAQVITAYLKIIEADYESGTIINVGSGKQQTIAQFYKKIAALLNVNIEPVWGQAQQRQFEPIKWEANICKLKSLIEWDDEL